MSSKYEKKLESLTKARKVRKDNTEAKKNKVLTLEEQLEIDLNNALRLENHSKKLFGDKNTLNDLETSLNNIGLASVLPSKAISKKRNYFRVYFGSNQFQRYNSYSREQVFKIGNQLSTKLKKMGLSGKITTVLNFDGVIRNGEATNIGEAIKIFEPNILSPMAGDEEIIKRFKSINKFSDITFFIHTTTPKQKVGGNSINNDCLYYCINRTIPQYNPWKSPASLKEFLGLKRDEMINIDLMEKIEKHIGKVGINITGDFTYTSKIGQLKNIHLTLTNNHYSINHKHNRKVVYVSYHERKLIMIDKNLNTDNENWTAYDGEKIIPMTTELFTDILNYRTEYIMTKRTNPKIPMEQEYNEYIQMAEEFKNKSNGEINLYKTGTILRTAQSILDETTKHITPEHIITDEAEIIQEATQGSTIFNEQYEGVGYKGDIKSMFPYIMSLKTTLVPIKRGITKQMTEQEFTEMKIKLGGNYAYGIYKCIIEKHEDNKINRLFRFNENNTYTSIDLRNADYLGLTIRLIINNDWNVMLYPRSYCLTGEEVFGKYINKLFKYKDEGMKGAKLLLNIISGAIGELNKSKIVVDEESEEDIDLDELNLLPINITHSRDKRFSIFTCVDKDYYFKSQFARFKPFLWAHARFMMAKLIKPINNIVVKCITDGIITTEKIEYFNELGKLKYEGYCENVIIKNNSTPQGTFIL